MRKLIYGINLTLDGCYDHTKGIADAELHQYFATLIKKAGLLIYGRKTYELMVPFWPDVARNQSMGESENEFALVFDSKDKLVFSRTLDGVPDSKTRLVRTDPEAEILRLKQEQGGDMLLGGVTLPSQLIAFGLVDEYHFVIHPVLAGEGTRLLKEINLPEQFNLKLVDSKIFKSGAVALRYLKE